ncbi:MAG: hypothetical protein AB1414_00825 [bacterium]
MEIESIFVTKLPDWKVLERKNKRQISFSKPFEREEIVFEAPATIPSMGKAGVIKMRINYPLPNEELIIRRSIEIAKEEMCKGIPPYLKYNEDEISIETITIENKRVESVTIPLYVFPGITPKVRSIIISMGKITYVTYGLYENAEILANILIENITEEER